MSHRDDIKYQIEVRDKNFEGVIKNQIGVMTNIKNQIKNKGNIEYQITER